MRVSFINNDSPWALEACERLITRYDGVDLKAADVVVALGGDGFMLQTLHDFIDGPRPIYGMNCGSVGFLMNDFKEENLLERLENAEKSIIHPLRMRAKNDEGAIFEAHAVNEVSLFRKSHQASKIAIDVDLKERLSELIADGVLIATPTGSTAYNLSVNGPILPINAPLLALTAISPFRPRHWRGAILPQEAQVRFRVLERDKRPVTATADNKSFDDVAEINVNIDKEIPLTILHDPGHSLEERILREQFLR